MPSNLGRGKSRTKKALLTTEQVARWPFSSRTHARTESADCTLHSPFLAGTRPSEQLGLLWEDVDFEANVIRIRRMQERDGALTNLTKTEAGTRDVPMGSLLRSLLLEWKLACPRRDDELHRVFPGLGTKQQWPLPHVGGGGGGPLLYWSFRRRFWASTLKKLGLPPEASLHATIAHQISRH